jgi:hypothetical protein
MRIKNGEFRMTNERPADFCAGAIVLRQAQDDLFKNIS